MLDLRVVVPFLSNLNGYHYNKSVNDIPGAIYAVEREIVVPDIAIPVLKKRLKEQRRLIW